MGGAKNHAIVLPDADLDHAADHLVAAAFGSAGQRCMAISAAVAVGSAADPLVDAIARRAARVKVGAGRDPGSEMGPVITRSARDGIARLIGTGEEQGARVAVDGRPLVVPGLEDGFFVGPTLIDQVSPQVDVYREEIFGPVLCALRAGALEDAIDLVNVSIPVPMAYHSFGGWKDSLFGDQHIHGPEGVSFYTRGKVVTSRWPEQHHATDASYHFPTAS